MKNINRVVVSGRLTRDSELLTTANGLNILNMSVAVNDSIKNANGEWEDKPNFFDVKMFGARAEKLAQYLSKGTKVIIEGKLSWSQWEKDGQKRSKVEIIVDEIEFNSRKEQTAPAYGASGSQSIEYDEDIPF
jgi:single-strand DNA-binding protein